MDGKADCLRKEFHLEPPTVPLSGDSRYLTQLWVSGKEGRCKELHQSDSSQLMSIGLEPGDANIGPNHQKIHEWELGADRNDPNHQKIQDKINAALKLVILREQQVLVQFWSPKEVGIGKHYLLTTIDQPFGIGVDDERLRSYRRDSESKPLVWDKDHEEEDHSPAARVFRRGLPEWTPDVTNYLPTNFPQLECAIRCNLHGYLALPVFESETRLCVGVLELLTTSTTYTSYAYEVQQLHNALETENLTCSQGFDFPPLYVPNERRQKDWYEIFGILEKVCEIHSLTFAQTWAVSPHASFVCHETVIQKSCSSFDTRCTGKVCMFTASLPYCFQDVGMWSFREACIARHLDRSCCLVGKALLTRGSCFCGDVTELSEEEYPLVHDARMNRLTSCFTIFLRSVEANDDYALEFFLPPGIKDSGYALSLVQTLKQSIPIGSGFELGDISSIVGLPMDLSDVTQTSSASVADNFTSSDSESLISSGSMYPLDTLSMEKTCVTSIDAGETSKQGRKRKLGATVTGMVTAEITFNGEMKVFHFPTSSGLSNLENEVAERFDLKGKSPRLKYRDEDDEMILIACDADLELAAGSKTSISLICLPT